MYGPRVVLARTLSRGQRHCGAEALELARGDLLRVLPVAGPRDADLGLGGGNPVEPLPGVVVFAEVGDAGCGVGGDEVRAVEGAGEILCYAAAEGRAGVDAYGQEVHVLGSVVRGVERVGEGGVGEHGDFDEVGAFILQA